MHHLISCKFLTAESAIKRHTYIEGAVADARNSLQLNSNWNWKHRSHLYFGFQFRSFAYHLFHCFQDVTVVIVFVAGRRQRWHEAGRLLHLTTKRLKLNAEHRRTHLLPVLHTHTHTHTFNGPFPGTTPVSQYQKGKTNLDFTEARDLEWQWHQLGRMQVCTLLQTDNHARTPPLSFYRPDALPAAQPTASKHWRLLLPVLRW